MSDTSVLIDLDRGAILPEIFKLPFDVGVPDLLFEGELKHWRGPALEPMGLRVRSLDGTGVSLAQGYRDRLTHALRLDLIRPEPGEPQISEIL